MVEYVKSLVALYGTEENEGQGLVEYALIIALIAVVAVAALTALGGGISGILGTITGSL
jgi:pilus assembly protein Flp/PilA